MFATIFQTRSLVLTAALLLGAATANAHPGGKPSGKNVSVSVKTTTIHNGFSGSVRYNRDFHDWKGYCFFPRYRCYGYYNPTCSTWYYWYQPFNCYLPISDMSIYPPVDAGLAPSLQSTATPLSLPPGATLAPPQ